VNLHAIASPYVAAINPMLPVEVSISTGYSTGADGSRTPSYATPVAMLGQVQRMSSRDLRQVSGLNLQGTVSAIYLGGDIEGVQRPLVKGGDLITYPDGTVWLVILSLESWGAVGSPQEMWCKVAVNLQNGS
jgi:hypothetical protein